MGVTYIGIGLGVVNHVDAVLEGSAGLVVGHALVGEQAIGRGGGRQRVAVVAQPQTQAQEVLAECHGRVVLQFKVVAGAGLRAVLSAVNNALGSQPLPELKLSVGFNAKSGQANIASAILNAFQLELPRRLQSSFFEVVQRAARDSDGQISYEALTELFKKTYGYLIRDTRFAFKTITMEHVGSGTRQAVDGVFLFDGEDRHIKAEGNGPLSATLNALHSEISGTLTIREYSEHSIGEGTDVKAASYVELVYVTDGQKKSAWGADLDEDIAVSGVKAVLNAASALDVVQSTSYGPWWESQAALNPLGAAMRI